MLAVSRLNYPGADALNLLHRLAENDTGVVKVHMDTLACMTGVTRFLEKPPSLLSDQGGAFWIYDKTEEEQRLLDPIFWERFDYALAERPELVIGRWEVLETVQGFSGFGLLRPAEEKFDALEFKSFENLWEEWSWQWEMFSHLLDRLQDGTLKAFLRRHVTQGWWLKIKMEPKIRILKKQRGPASMETFDLTKEAENAF